MKWLRKAVGVLLPWPSRTQRRAAVASAEQEKQRSQASAATAAAVQQDIWRLADENHWASVWARHLRNGGGH